MNTVSQSSNKSTKKCPERSGEVILSVDRLSIGYRGGGIGVSGVGLTVPRGAVVTLIGPNGAGKSSTLKGIAGLFNRDTAYRMSGNVVFAGENITRFGPLHRARLGIAMVPESDKVFNDLTVVENLRLGGIRAGRQAATQLDIALEVFPALKQHLRRRAGYLSGGQRQMLAVASALCGAPKLLLVDELSLGLSPELVESMALSLQRIVSNGLPILMAEQNVGVALQLSWMIHVLDGGRIRASGTPADLQAEGDIAATYLGVQ